MTLRDLFRWAERYRQAEELHVTRGAKYFDWDQYIAEQGSPLFFLLSSGGLTHLSLILTCFLLLSDSLF